MDKTGIINKIIDHYNFNSNAEFARFLGIKPQVLSNWKSRNTYDIELLSKKCTEISTDWLVSGKGSLKKGAVIKEDAIKSNFEEITENKIPIFNLEASEKLIPLVNDLNELNYISFPNAPIASGATYVMNNNMYPILKTGDLIIYEIVPTNIETIKFGEMYLISIYIDDERTYKTIRYIQKSDLGVHFLKMTNEDKQYLDKNIEISKISDLALIKASIKSF